MPGEGSKEGSNLPGEIDRNDFENPLSGMKHVKGEKGSAASGDGQGMGKMGA